MQEAKAIQQQAPQKNQIMFLETGGRGCNSQDDIQSI